MPTIENLSSGIDAFTSNVHLVHGDRTVLVDAGANYDVASAVRDRVDRLDAVVLTHTHEDHVGNVSTLRDAFGVETWGFDPGSEHVDHAIDDGEAVRLGDATYEALHTPGHKNDHLVFVPARRTAGNGGGGRERHPIPAVGFVGDLVFSRGGFGRTDLDEGDRSRLVESIERLESALPEGIERLHTGHGPAIETPARGVAASLRAARTY